MTRKPLLSLLTPLTPLSPYPFLPFFSQNHLTFSIAKIKIIPDFLQRRRYHELDLVGSNSRSSGRACLVVVVRDNAEVEKSFSFCSC
jgi:hypothetical protein